MRKQNVHGTKTYIESGRNTNGKYKKFLDVRVTTEGHRMKIG